MHGLSKIHIQNFRACEDVTLPLSDFTPLVGQNNTGKSTILEAIKAVLCLKPFSRSDFTNPNLPIILAACIDGISPEILALVPVDRQRAAIERFCVQGRLWIRVTATGTARPVREVWTPEGADHDAVPETWQACPTGLPEAFNALLPEALHIAAMDDVGEDLGKAKAGSTIKGLLDEVMEPILAQHLEVAAAIESLRGVLAKTGANRSPLLHDFDRRATSALGEFFPGLDLDIDVPVIEAKELFKAGDLHVTDRAGGDRRRFDEVGSGAQRSIQMALVRLLADMRHGDQPRAARRMLLIDEPELYLHPQGVRILREALRSLSNVGFQIVFSTHSPIMLSRENAPDTVIVRRNARGRSETRRPLRSAVAQAIADAEAQAQTLFELGNIADIYFSEKVIVCEGKTDRRLLPLAYEKLFGRSHELDRICFVSLSGCGNILKGMSVLNAMGVSCGAIADLDFAFTHARKGPHRIFERDGADMADVRRIFQRLVADGEAHVDGGGLPTGNPNIRAEQSWKAFADDAEGAGVAEACHHAAAVRSVWIWRQGCMEDVLGCDDKGEEAILAQESRLRAMDAARMDAEVPGLRSCLEWMRQLPSG